MSQLFVTSTASRESTIGRQMSTPKTPRALIHYSTAEADAFDIPNGHFKVKTQGRLYAIGVNNPLKVGITKALTPRSALLFTDAALTKFSPHTCWTLSFYKRFLGQYRSKEFGDVVWKQSDTVREGDVLRIKDVQIVPINDPGRKAWQRAKVILVLVLELTLLAIVLAIIAAATAMQFQWSFPAPYQMIEKMIPGAYDFLDASATWLRPKVPAVFVGLLVIVPILFVRVSRQLATKCFREDLNKLGY
ncbi:hypothetical protein BOP96_17690 [Pseudomonas sp. FSL W5-0203]|nr:hypothetical protein PFLuk1_03569 [Pseudomonas fluorescens]OJT29070.1 hypothetical protein BOP96_17690 [Pseudomonas sp. FSL W5-0203]